MRGPFEKYNKLNLLIEFKFPKTYKCLTIEVIADGDKIS